jgi:PleD family two-component response regulator
MAAVEDLLFKSKISETAAKLGIESAFPRSPAKLLDAARSSPPDILILDLASERFEPLELLRTVSEDEELSGIPTVGFLPHVEKDLARAAKEAGCGKIMARSAFTKELPKIISGEKT